MIEVEIDILNMIIKMKIRIGKQTIIKNIQKKIENQIIMNIIIKFQIKINIMKIIKHHKEIIKIKTRDNNEDNEENKDYP